MNAHEVEHEQKLLAEVVELRATVENLTAERDEAVRGSQFFEDLQKRWLTVQEENWRLREKGNALAYMLGHSKIVMPTPAGEVERQRLLAAWREEVREMKESDYAVIRELMADQERLRAEGDRLTAENKRLQQKIRELEDELQVEPSGR